MRSFTRHRAIWLWYQLAGIEKIRFPDPRGGRSMESDRFDIRYVTPWGSRRSRSA
ncbi:MAG: hypothetical protein ACLU3I_19950 [Acutalibacteraceae bacterium]